MQFFSIRYLYWVIYLNTIFIYSIVHAHFPFLGGNIYIFLKLHSFQFNLKTLIIS